MKLIQITNRHGLTALLAALLATSTPVVVAKTYLGSGGTSCAEYIAVKETLPDAGRAIDLWLLGYISGLNFHSFANTNVDLLANQTAANVISFVQGYCSTNGSKTLNNAANEYWVRLIKTLPK